jgi:hypothetical protein
MNTAEDGFRRALKRIGDACAGHAPLPATGNAERDYMNDLLYIAGVVDQILEMYPESPSQNCSKEKP